MKSPKAEKERLDRVTVEAIVEVAESIHGGIEKLRKPVVDFPVRSLSNVRYDLKKGYFEIGRERSSRTLTVNTAKTFAQTLKMMALSKELVETSDFATKRDAYYQSKNWGEACFDEQGESDTVMDDIEAMFSVHGVSREQLRYIPDEHGGAIAGELLVHDTDLESGKTETIDCTRFGSGAYSIPSLVEHLRFETKAKFVLCIETGGMFQRLQSHKFWSKAHCILVSMAGVPTRATRRFVRLLSEQCKLPVYAFVDCDPYGISNIYRTLKVGSGNAAHINRFFCVPRRELPRRHAPGHRRLQAADPPAQGRGRQARQGRAQERSVLRAPQAVARGDRAADPDGRACRAAGAGALGPELRDRRVPAGEAQEPGEVPAVARGGGQDAPPPPGTIAAGSRPCSRRHSSHTPWGSRSSTRRASTGAKIHEPSEISRSSCPGPQPA